MGHTQYLGINKGMGPVFAFCPLSLQPTITPARNTSPFRIVIKQTLELTTKGAASMLRFIRYILSVPFFCVLLAFGASLACSEIRWRYMIRSESRFGYIEALAPLVVVLIMFIYQLASVFHRPVRGHFYSHGQLHTLYSPPLPACLTDALSQTVSLNINFPGG